MPTHDDLTLVIAGWPYAEFADNKKDIEGNYLKAIELAPDLPRGCASATREAPFAGRGGPELFPQALRSRLGSRGRRRLQQGLHNGAGILDAFRGRRTLRRRPSTNHCRARGHSRRAMGEYQRTRDAQVGAMYDFTCELATARAAATRTATDPWGGSRQPD